MPVPKIPAKSFRLMPQAKIMPKKIAMNTSEVPRSGCFMTSRKGTPTYAATGRRSDRVFSLPTFSCKRAAKETIMIILENSDGCRVIGPS